MKYFSQPVACVCNYCQACADVWHASVQVPCITDSTQKEAAIITVQSTQVWGWGGGSRDIWEGFLEKVRPHRDRCLCKTSVSEKWIKAYQNGVRAQHCEGWNRARVVKDTMRSMWELECVGLHWYIQLERGWLVKFSLEMSHWGNVFIAKMCEAREWRRPARIKVVQSVQSVKWTHPFTLKRAPEGRKTHPGDPKTQLHKQVTHPCTHSSCGNARAQFSLAWKHRMSSAKTFTQPQFSLLSTEEWISGTHQASWHLWIPNFISH